MKTKDQLIDELLDLAFAEDIGDGDCTTLCHMTNNKYRHALTLCHTKKGRGNFPYLTDTSRSRIDIFAKHGLNRVNDHNLWF